MTSLGIVTGEVHRDPVFLPVMAVHIQPGQLLRFFWQLAGIHGYLGIVLGYVGTQPATAGAQRPAAELPDPRDSRLLLERETLDAEEIDATMDGRELPPRKRVIIPTWASKKEAAGEKRSPSLFGAPKPAASS